MSISNNLRTYRKMCSLHQDQVANALGIDRSTYSYYETGKTTPSVDTLVKLSAMFGVELYTLIDYNTDSSMHGDEVGYYTKSEQTLPVNRLFRDEQDLIMIYRQLNDASQSELSKRARQLLDKQKEQENE